MLNHQYEQQIIEKIRTLPPGQVAEVEDFVDFLLSRSEARSVSHGSKACRKQFHLCVG